jgi:NADPH:quinone reductase-like Zn-dependent oxidoreductase
MKAVEYKKYGAPGVFEYNEVAKPEPKCKSSLAKNGLYLPTVFGIRIITQMLVTAFFGSKKIKSSSTGMLPVKTRLAYLEEIRELLRAGIIKTVIDRKYALQQMAEAHSYVAMGHKKGNVVIEINNNLPLL